MKFNIYTDSVNYWENLTNAVACLDPKRIALSGGSSADILDHIEQEGVMFYQVDERYVASDHEDSNQKLLRGKLKDQGNLVTFDTSRSLDEVVQDYEDKLTLDEDGYLFDLLILGVGPDGHVASLFPLGRDEEKLKSPKIQNLRKREDFCGYLNLSANGLVAHTQTTEFAVLDRLTLTYEAIEKSRSIMILLWGEKKKPIVETMQNPHPDPPRREGMLPVHQILEMEQSSVWFYA